MGLSTLAIAGGFGLDLVIGEPPNWAHPVAWFGRVIDAFDRPWSHSRAVGIAGAVCLPVIVGALVGTGTFLLVSWDWRAGAAFGSLVVFVTTSLRALLRTVNRVTRLASTDLPTARIELRALVGRDASGFDPTHVRSAAIESLAENLADGLVAPLTWFVLGTTVGAAVGGGAVGLALGCAGAAWLKSVDTMDAMLGYPGRPLGFGAARLDDMAMYLPARIAALLIALAFLRPGCLGRAADWRGAVASPNAGWPMGTVAAALDVRLEKPGQYVLNPGAPWPSATDVNRAIVRVGGAGVLAYGLTGVIVWS